MLIATIIVICVLIAFVLATFLMTYKNYKFDLEGGVLHVQSKGSHLKIYFNEVLLKDVFSPRLYEGETVEFKIAEKEFSLFCKCNFLGNKLQVDVLDGDKVVATNNVKIKEKKK